MQDIGEIVKPNQSVSKETPRPEQDKGKLYGELLHKEARSLLSKYLPEALPQGPTDIFTGIIPCYIGKFKDKHCIALEDSELHQLVQLQKKEIAQLQQWEKKFSQSWDKLESERFRLMKTRVEEGRFDFDDINKMMDEKLELLKQNAQSPETKVETQDQSPKSLSREQGQYSIDFWHNVYSLVHELIHQKQAELNPSAFPILTSPELDNIDPNTINRNQLYNLLLESHKEYNRRQNNNSIYFPVIEGVAVLGSLYVMGKLADDLAKFGEKDTADKIIQVRKIAIREEIIGSKREARTGRERDYNLYYVEGFNIMRKLYKHFGLENIPKMLVTVDLNACRQITKGSPQYKQIMENPTLLPGLLIRIR